MERRKFYIPVDEHTRYYHNTGDRVPNGFNDVIEDDEDSTTEE